MSFIALVFLTFAIGALVFTKVTERGNNNEY